MKEKPHCTQTTPNGKLRCSKNQGHSDPHRDPETGVQWNHPSIPYGMRHPRRDA